MYDELINSILFDLKISSLPHRENILIENFSGKLPFWLAPKQVIIATITSDVEDYGREILTQLKDAGIRAELDIRNEKISYKVREHSTKKVPIIMALGKNEKANESVSIRRIGSSDSCLLYTSPSPRDS